MDKWVITTVIITTLLLRYYGPAGEHEVAYATGLAKGGGSRRGEKLQRERDDLSVTSPNVSKQAGK